jgi:hypothetical protein
MNCGRLSMRAKKPLVFAPIHTKNMRANVYYAAYDQPFAPFFRKFSSRRIKPRGFINPYILDSTAEFVG